MDKSDDTSLTRTKLGATIILRLLLIKEGKEKLTRDPRSRSLSRFLWHEDTRSVSTPPGWDARLSQVFPQH